MKIFKRLALILLGGLSILMLIMFLLSPLLHVRKLALDLNNPIVNNHYEGWYRLSVDEDVEVSFPNNWTLEQKDSDLFIVNESGSIVAFGYKHAVDHETYINAKEQGKSCVEDFFCDEVISYKNESFTTNNFVSFAVARLLEYNFREHGVKTLVYLQLGGSCYDYYFWFLESDQATLDAVEAIGFSMTRNN